MAALWVFVAQHWFSFMLVGIVAIAIWRVYKRWHRLKIW